MKTPPEDLWAFQFALFWFILIALVIVLERAA